MYNIEAARKELASALGSDNVLDDDFILSSYTQDGTLFYYPLTKPSLVVLPHCRDDVQKIIQAANKYKIPVVPSGGRTNLWGGVDSRGGIAIDMCNMNKLLAVDTKNLTFTVEAGAGVHHTNMELEKLGFIYTTHALNFAPIAFGSEVSKCTGGEVGSMYGHVSKRLIALEVVLGNGDILVTGSAKVIKGVPLFQQSGIPDLTQLFVAAEGAYGVITEVTMAMQMLPVAYTGMDIKFEGTYDGFRAAVDACHELRTRKGLICNAHLIDWYTLWAVERGLTKKPIDKTDGEAAREKYGQVLIVEIESFVSEEENKLKKDAVLEICKKFGGKYAGDEMAKTFKAGERGDCNMMKILFNESSPWVPFQGDVPYAGLAPFYERALALLDQEGWPREKMGFVAALGDESIIPFYWTFPDPHDKQNVQKSIDIAWKTLALYMDIGVIPYRIGRVWQPYVLSRLDPSYLKYIRNIKKQFDPNNIMNPGVSVFEEVNQ